MPTNSLYHYANEYRKRMTDESEIEDTDMTDILKAELETMIKKNEIIIININAKMRLGKSTLGMAIAYDIFQSLKRNKKKSKKEKFSMQNIARDEMEYSQMMRDPERIQDVILTDEKNALESTGENVTTEKALRDVYSDVQAARYVHSISCSPKETTDTNADIMLFIIAIDKRNMITRSKLYYRYYEGGQEYIQLLGYVDWYVGHIIKNWMKVEDVFLKKNKTQKENDYINEMAKKDFYVEYMIKKHEKMDILNKEGIFRPRILKYSECILSVVMGLKDLTKSYNLIDHNITRNYVKMEFRKRKIPQSIIGEELSTREAMGILSIYKTYYKTVRDLKKIMSKLENNPDEELREEVEQLKELKNSIAKTADMQISELEHYAEINRKYNEHLKGA